VSGGYFKNYCSKCGVCTDGAQTPPLITQQPQRRVSNSLGGQSGPDDDMYDLRKIPNMPGLKKIPSRRSYLTIDDSCTIYTSDIVDYITENRIPTIFFIHGEQCSRQPLLLQKIIKSPYATVGVHTWTHKKMSSTGGCINTIYGQLCDLNMEQSKEEINKSIELINNNHEIVGKEWTGRKFFRYPMLMTVLEMESFLRSTFDPIPTDLKTGIAPENYSMRGIFMGGDGFSAMELLNDQQYISHAKGGSGNIQIFNTTYMLKPSIVIGLHDNKHTITHIKMLQKSGAKFYDSQLA
jgi:hypothetical protein